MFIIVCILLGINFEVYWGRSLLVSVDIFLRSVSCWFLVVVGWICGRLFDEKCLNKIWLVVLYLK